MALTRFAVCLLAYSALLGCVHAQLNSSVSGASITVSPLRDPSNILTQHQAGDQDAVIALLGQPAWDQLGGFGRLVLLGFAILSVPDFDPDALYLVAARSGFDEDANLDNEKDLLGTPVQGEWHAIMSGAQILTNSARISTLTEALYQYVLAELDTLDNEDVLPRLDVLAAELVPDINEDGSADYFDALIWSQLNTALEYRREIRYIDDLSRAIIEGDPAETIVDLSRIVVEGEAGGFELSGSVRVVEFNKVDGDVNDRNADYLSNDNIVSPQVIDSPIILGGYVNAPGAGDSGRSFAAGDMDDFFAVDILAGQVISLAVADNPLVNDLDLYLYDTDLNLVDGSLGVSELESLQVGEAGRYIVNVNVFEGASNYRLSIGQNNSELPAPAVRLSDDFAPEELIVRYRESVAQSTDPRRRARSRGMRHVAGGRHRANLLRFDEGLDPAFRRSGPGRSARSAARLTSEQTRKQQTITAMKLLRRQPETEHVDLNYRVRAAATPDDAFYPDQRWHYELLNLPAAWEGSTGGGVRVAVIDTGVLLDHPDMDGQLLPGFDFVSNFRNALDGDGIDANPNDPGDGGGLVDSSFHGTHVAGTIAAASNNSIGVAGVAWDARVMPLRVLGEEGAGDSYDILQAVRYAAGLPNDSGTVPDQPVDIINLSLGGGGFSAAEQALYDEVAARGIIVVAAAGNDGRRRAFYPASYDNVVSVAAVNINRDTAFYSNFHATVDVAAPGGDSSTNDINGDGAPDLILSTNGDDSSGRVLMNYVYFEGTSMAAPHVSGVAALMKAVYPSLTPGQFNALLQSGEITDDLGEEGRDENFGWGLLNGLKAVGAAQELAGGASIAENPLLSVSPRAVNFGAVATQLPLEVYNGGAGQLLIESVATEQTWITINQPQQESSRDIFLLDVDRSALETGLHRGEIVISSNAGSESIAVLVTVAAETTDVSGNAGYHYVLLVDPATDEVVKQDAVVARDGAYQYRLSNVPAGQYILVAGSDSDNDFFICDAGEACGAWPVLSGTTFSRIDISTDLENLDFTTGFESGVLSAEALGSSEAGFTSTRRNVRGPTERALDLSTGQ